MDPKFWHDKWASNQIGFHEEVYHPLLCRHWDSLNVDKSATVFVPLCGKSQDMVWLRGRGHEVAGVELSGIAARAFFDENDVPVECDEVGGFKRYRGGGYTIVCGDIFELTAEILGVFAAVYDRAALIALPRATRRAYVRLLQTLCRPQTHGLLITVSYPADAISPPPFAVSSEEVDALYAGWCDIELIGTGETSVKGVAGRETAFRLAVR